MKLLFLVMIQERLHLVLNIFLHVNQAWMSWRYPIPHVILQIITNPVDTPQSAGSMVLTHAEKSSELEWSCVLQYWDEQQKKYVDFVSFVLHERYNKSYQLIFSSLSRTSQMIKVARRGVIPYSCEWRVCVVNGY